VSPVPDLSRAERRYRLALGVGTLALLAASWPLWVGSADFPRIPFAPRVPVVAPIGVFAALLGSVLGGAWRRWPMGVAAGLMIVEFLQDQQRFQPWAYQYVMAAIALTCAPTARALGLCRLFTVALYFHSALSKLDVSFAEGLAGAYLPGGWPSELGVPLAVSMSVGELLIALGLILPRWRRVALWSAVIMHASLILILGIWLNHSLTVLIWNAAFLAQDLILFGPGALAPPPATEAPSRLAPLAGMAFLAAAILPLGERLGLVDPWPGFAFYAAHVDRVEVLIARGDLVRLPPGFPHRFVGGSVKDDDETAALDLTEWSRRARGVPIYPGARAGLGLAEWLIGRYGLHGGVEVRSVGRAHPWTGERKVAVARGLAEVRHLGDRFTLNAHPAP